MTYKDLLNPWCIIRLLPNMQSIIVARFRRRNDAEAHLRILHQLIPSVVYKLVFETTPKYPAPTAQQLQTQSQLNIVE